MLFTKLGAQGSVMFVVICSSLRVTKDMLPSHTLKRLTLMAVRTPTPPVFLECNAEPPINSRMKSAIPPKKHRQQDDAAIDFRFMLKKPAFRDRVTHINSVLEHYEAIRTGESHTLVNAL